MALSLVGTDFGRTQETKGFHRRNGRTVQDGGPRLESSGRHAADDQRWDLAPRTSFLLDQKQEEEAEQITHNTLASYRSMICQHIRPKWGDAHLKDVRPTLIQDWLRRLDLSPKYKGHIRSLMYRLFDKAMLWELLEVDRNPMDLVEVKGISKRKKRPCVLQVKDAWQILDELAQPYRTIVLIALCFGLRISEILGLRWTDFDFKRSVVLIQ